MSLLRPTGDHLIICPPECPNCGIEVAADGTSYWCERCGGTWDSVGTSTWTEPSDASSRDLESAASIPSPTIASGTHPDPKDAGGPLERAARSGPPTGEGGTPPSPAAPSNASNTGRSS